MTYLGEFQLVRIFFQPERIARVFNLGELRLILASIDFVTTQSIIYRSFMNLDTFMKINVLSDEMSAIKELGKLRL